MKQIMRERKVLLIAVSLYLCYIAVMSAILPFRVTTDEGEPMIDIHTLIEAGSQQGSFSYLNGPAYQTGTATVLRVLGLSPIDTEVLSPFIGGVVLGEIGIILFLIYREESVNRPWWGASGFLPVMLVIPGLINRLRETSHKAFTFSLVLLGLLLAYYEIKRHPDIRRYVIVILIFISISILNYIWGLTYGILISILLISGRSRPILAVLPVIIPYTLMTNLPSIPIEIGYFLRILNSLISTSGTASGGGSGSAAGTASGGSSSAIELIAAWPAIDIRLITVSTWFIWASGIFFIALLTAIAFFRVILTYIRSNKISSLGLMLVVVSIYHGSLTLVLFTAGDIATVKRMIIIPGLFGVLYVAVQLASIENNGDLKRSFPKLNATTAIVGMMIIFIVFAGLATPRVMLDGNQKPIDTYATENELEQVNWLSKYQSGCAHGVGWIDNRLGNKITGDRLPVVTEVGMRPKVIYSSGDNGVVVCSQ